MNTPITLSLLVAASAILLSIKRIPPGQAFTVYRFGRYQRTLDAGVHWIVPLIERIAHRVSLTGRALTLAPQYIAGGRDIATVQGAVYFQVLDARTVEPEVDHLDDVVLGAVMDGLRRLVPHGEQLSAAELNGALKRDLNRELRSHGLTVTRCQFSVQRGPDASESARSAA
jgi:regulator of protease activity HflC (stomatin/prohibitin superfamily)